MRIMKISHISLRNVGSNAIFMIFDSRSLPARLQSQRQLQSALLTRGLPCIPAGRRSFSERQRDFEIRVFLESQGGLTRKHYKTQWNTHAKIRKIGSQTPKSKLQRGKIRVRMVIWRRFFIDKRRLSGKEGLRTRVSDTVFQNYAYFARGVTKNEKHEK